MKKKLIFVMCALVLIAASGCSAPAAADPTNSVTAQETASVGVDAGSPPPPTDTASPLTASEALNTALTLAGISDFSDVDLNKLELDDGVYKIEFKTGHSQYQYEISAATGEVIRQDAPTQNAPGQAAAEPTVPASEPDEPKQDVPAQDASEPPAASGDQITSQDAEAIALEHAGLTRTETTYIHSYIRYYHGAPYAYQVEFGVRSTHYWYAIDLFTGEILSHHNAGH